MLMGKWQIHQLSLDMNKKLNVQLKEKKILIPKPKKFTKV
ncbi:hypothetical protein NY78_4403 [Desulfovibrio sp. TomC]|nr:hypothetical protein NY78_4403 [Desulfovibrio sp. TomC]